LKDLDNLTGGIVSSVIKNEEFKGEVNETALVRFAGKGKVKASMLLLIGVGEKAPSTRPPASANVAGAATRFLRKRNIKSFALLPRADGDAGEIAQNAATGFVISQFELDKYRTNDKNNKTVDTFVLCVEDARAADLKDGLNRGQIIGESMNFTRELANEPPNVLHPTEMANARKRWRKKPV
jgi:leucyl aminopeptidase